MSIPHEGHPTPNIITGGQPDKSVLEDLKQQGVKTIINLRAEQEMQDIDEASIAASLGMNYVHIPIAGPDDVTFDNASILHDAICEHEEQGKILIHCASSNRVGALLAIRAYHKLDQSPGEAMDLGLEAGLTGLKPKVASMLA